MCEEAITNIKEFLDKVEKLKNREKKNEVFLEA